MIFYIARIHGLVRNQSRIEQVKIKIIDENTRVYPVFLEIIAYWRKGPFDFWKEREPLARRRAGRRPARRQGSAGRRAGRNGSACGERSGTVVRRV
jgi:hypothetical protein